MVSPVTASGRPDVASGRPLTCCRPISCAPGNQGTRIGSTADGGEIDMRRPVMILGVLLLSTGSSQGDDRLLDWVKVTPRAAWQARDSAGELVHRDRLWLIGGWFDSFSSPPRNVWSSPDGATWTLATKDAPWRSSDLPMCLGFDGRMRLMGGWHDGGLLGHGAAPRSGRRSTARTGRS